MSNSSAADRHGVEVRIDRTPTPHLVLHAEGAVTLPSVREALRALEALQRERDAPTSLVIDALHVSRFGRGAVVEIARWIPRNAAGLERVVLVSASSQLRSSVLALAACAPRVRVVSVQTRGEANAALGAAVLDLTG
jgi:hypothetical protein